MEDRLLELLSAERSGVFALRGMLRTATPEQRGLLTTVLDGERESCRILGKDLVRRGVSPGVNIGNFHEKILALAEPSDRLRLLVKGQQWVVRKIDEALLAVAEPSSREELMRIRRVHVDNIAAVERTLVSPTGEKT